MSASKRTEKVIKDILGSLPTYKSTDIDFSDLDLKEQHAILGALLDDLNDSGETVEIMEPNNYFADLIANIFRDEPCSVSNFKATIYSAMVHKYGKYINRLIGDVASDLYWAYEDSKEYDKDEKYYSFFKEDGRGNINLLDIFK